MSYRIGTGIDYHRLVEERELWIGGIHIPYHMGSLGHSDADVLLHAICDALLGALSLGDIGTHFPDTDEKYRNIDSKLLLNETYQMILDLGYKVVNIDSTLLLEEPRIKPFIHLMQHTIAMVLKLPPTDISIKATTTEKLGSIGRMEGLAANATVLLKKDTID